MNADEYHFSPELLDLLTNAIWQLVRSKPKLLDFFHGSGVSAETLKPYRQQLELSKDSFKMPIVTRRVLEDINSDGDAQLGARRRIIQRVVEWEDYSTSWPEKRDAAELAVNRVRSLVNRSDSFTRSREELERERAKQRAAEREKQRERELTAQRKEALQRKLVALSAHADPVARGNEFEATLNELFEHEKILIRESFRVVRDGTVEEQIDGAISVDSILYLVEIKWHAAKLGPDVVAQHMARLLVRSGASGLFISKSGFTPAAISSIVGTLPHCVTVCADWHEILYALETDYPLERWLQKKFAAAVTHKNVYYRYGVDFK